MDRDKQTLSSPQGKYQQIADFPKTYILFQPEPVPAAVTSSFKIQLEALLNSSKTAILTLL